VANSIEDIVWRRAAGCCEYCQIPQALYKLPFQIDHIIAKQHGGSSAPENLALACFHCNTHKGPNIAGLDPEDGALTRLYHPRRDDWTEHFDWNGAVLAGRSALGRATVQVLAINDPNYVAVRRSLIAEGVFPGPPARGA